MRYIWFFGFVLLIALSVVCTPPKVVGVLPSEIDVQLKRLKPPRDKALIYIIRPEQVFSGYNTQITCDGEFIGFTRSGMYIALFVDPGLHIFTSEDSVRIVDDFNRYYKKCESNKISILSSKDEKEETEKASKAHIAFIKKHNYAMQCYRTQSCDPEKMNHILKMKPVPLEMYHALSVQGGNTYFLIQSFKPSWNYPHYLLNDFDYNEGMARLKDLRHSRNINPNIFPKEYIRLNKK